MVPAEREGTKAEEGDVRFEDLMAAGLRLKERGFRVDNSVGSSGGPAIFERTLPCNFASTDTAVFLETEKFPPSNLGGPLHPAQHSRSFGGCDALPDPHPHLLTHGHEDHVADAEEVAKASGAELIAPYETAMWFSTKGGIHPGDQSRRQLLAGGSGGHRSHPHRGAVHSSTLPDGSRGGVACGYLLSDGAHSVYHAGDTALSVEFDLIGRMWTPDVALLPIGGTFTMGYADLPAAMDMLNCRQVVGMHYNTFPPIEIDTAEAKHRRGCRRPASSFPAR